MCSGKPETKSTFHRHLLLSEEVDGHLDSFKVFVNVKDDGIWENSLAQTVQTWNSNDSA